jgi:transposase
MMGRQTSDQSQLFYLFNLEQRIPANHLLRRINPIVSQILADMRENLAVFHSDIGRPSIDPELMLRMLIVAYCYGIRFERRVCEEVALHLAYRWFCRLDLDDVVPDHSTFPVNRHGRFRDSGIFRQIFEAVVRACMNAGLVKGEGFAVDASVIEPTPAAIMASLLTRSTGRCQNDRHERLPGSLPGLMTRIPMPIAVYRR